MKRILLSAALGALCALGMSASFNGNGVYYMEIDSTTCYVTGCASSVTGNVTIPATVVSPVDQKTYTVVKVGKNAFQNKTTITGINLPATVKTIENSAFYKATNLATVTMPGVEMIGSYAFQQTALSGTLTLPETCTTLGSGAFSWTKITKVIIPASIETLNSAVFYKSPILEFEVVPENPNMKSWNGAIYNNDFTSLLRYPQGATTLTLNPICTTMGKECMYWCDGFTGKLEIPAQIDSMEQAALQGVCNVTDLVILGQIPILPDFGVYDMSKLENLTLPASVDSIGGFCFCYDTKLKTITFEGTTPPSERPAGARFENVVFNQCKLIVPTGCVAAYRAKAPWNRFTTIEEAPSTGVEDVISQEQPEVYYDLQGRLVANPSRGLYIRVQGKKTSKIIL